MKGFCWNPEDATYEMSSRTIEKNLKNLFQACGLRFQFHQKLKHDVVGLIDKPKTSSHCRLPLANPQFAEIIDRA